LVRERLLQRVDKIEKAGFRAGCIRWTRNRTRGNWFSRALRLIPGAAYFRLFLEALEDTGLFRLRRQQSGAPCRDRFWPTVDGERQGLLDGVEERGAITAERGFANRHHLVLQHTGR